jgi:hypothetical protein
MKRSSGQRRNAQAAPGAKAMTSSPDRSGVRSADPRFFFIVRGRPDLQGGVVKPAAEVTQDIRLVFDFMFLGAARGPSVIKLLTRLPRVRTARLGGSR